MYRMFITQRGIGELSIMLSMCMYKGVHQHREGYYKESLAMFYT